MKKIYRTKEWKGYGKQNYYYNEYRQKGDMVSKFKCNRFKFFDGDENNWETKEDLVDSWNVKDPDMPSWLKKFIK